MNRAAPGPLPARLLRHYLLAWTLGALLVVWLILAALAWTTAFHEARKFSDGQLVAIARLWLTASPSSASPLKPSDVPALQHEFLQEVALLAWDDGRLVTDTHGLAAGLGGASLPAQGFATLDLPAAGGAVRTWRAYAVQAEAGARRVLVLMDMQQRHELGKDIAEHVAQPAVLVLPLVALLLWSAVRRGLRPLDRLSSDVAALDGLAGQRLDTRHRFREFSSTVSAINRLVDSLQARARREREFASDVAHELRTPLTALVLQAGAAQHDPSPERLAQLEATALRAGHILAQLLDLARAQRSGPQGEDPAWKPVALGELVAKLVASHAPTGFQSGHELSLEQPDEAVMVRTQPLLLELALRNLIENALRHTPAGTQVGVQVWRTADALGVSVSDDGQRPGAPPGPAEADRKGLGLGLRLVIRIAEELGATLERDFGEAPMTTRFTLRWSLA